MRQIIHFDMNSEICPKASKDTNYLDSLTDFLSKSVYNDVFALMVQ